MHELSVATAIIEQVEKTREEEKAAKVNYVTLKIGALAGVENDALEMAFPFAAENTGTAGAELIIENIPVSVKCEDCGETTEPEIPFIACTACSSQKVVIVAGRELIIKTINME